jgi:hypothetical protein
MTKNNKIENFSIFRKLQKQCKNWKERSIKNSKKILAQEKRIRDLLKSRLNWRTKYYAEKAITNELKQTLKVLEENQERRYEKVTNHSYCLEIILFTIWLRSSSSISLEGVRRVINVFNKVFDFDFPIPCKNSIRNWEKKHSLHRLDSVKAKVEGEWTIIVDESIAIGEEKILLILGVPLSNYKFGDAVNFTDIKVLEVLISKSWKSKEISEVLNGLKSAGYNIKYVVSDGCCTLKSAIKSSELTQVPDCTHVFGNILKNEFKDLATYQSFDKACNLLHKQTNIGADAVIAPAKYRSKGKFLNLYPKANWAKKMLTIMELPLSERAEILTQSMQNKLAFITDYKPLIQRLHLQCEITNKLSKILKNNGLSKQSVYICRTVIAEKYAKKMCLIIAQESAQEQIQLSFQLTTDTFWQKIEAYLSQGLELLKKIDLPRIICTSDIIESMFGKYKARVKKGNSSITDDCLNITNFTQNFSRAETKKAMEETKIIDITNWRKKNCKDSLRAKKQKMFEKVG